jgi:dolichyl-phosphate-mannose-protein mannosyltransferase
MSSANVHWAPRLAWLKEWLRTTEGKLFLGLLVLIALVRFALSYVLRVSPDLQAYETWGELILRHFFHAYSYGMRANDVWLFPNYPPLTMYLYALVEIPYFGAAHLLGLHVSSCACSNIFRPFLLIPGVLTDSIQVCIIYALARTRLSSKVALLITASYAFSPAVLIDDVGWGQTDNLALLIAVSALLLALRKQGVWAGVLLGLAIVLKPEPWIFIPLVLLYLYRWAGRQAAVRAVCAIAVTALIFWGPYLLPPHPEILVWQRSASNAIQLAGPVATRNAYNLWWLLGAQHLNINASLIGPLTAQIVGTILFVATILLACVYIWQDASPARLWAAAALVSIGFFDVATLQYERYIFPAIGLFLLASLYDQRYWKLYVAVSATAFLCLGATIFTQGYGLAARVDVLRRFGAMLTSASWWVAAANIAIFVLATRTYLRSNGADDEARTQVAVGHCDGTAHNYASAPAFPAGQRQGEQFQEAPARGIAQREA